jgi:Ohr subfamily peroxiredoxin
VYTAKTRTTGGRERGLSRSSDGRLDIKLSLPESPGLGTNPEQLFAAAWSASFGGAIADAAARRNLKLPATVRIDAEIDLIAEEEVCRLRARFAVRLAGVNPETGAALLEDAALRCPYSRATRNFVDLAIDLETS